MSTARAIIKSVYYQRPENPEAVVRKKRPGRRTKETPNHRCWMCEHREEILNAKPGEWMWRTAREDPFLGCGYARRMAKQAGKR